MKQLWESNCVVCGTYQFIEIDDDAPLQAKKKAIESVGYCRTCAKRRFEEDKIVYNINKIIFIN